MENGTLETMLSPEEKLEFQEKMSDIYIKYCSEYMDVIDRIIEEGNRKATGSSLGSRRERRYMKGNIEQQIAQQNCEMEKEWNF